MSESAVTWLLPVKNGLAYLPATLESVAAQTYTGAQIIAWDNGSSDGTIDELRRWIPSRIPGRIIENRPMSLAKSLAALVEESQTEICARIDADDINRPTRLAEQMAFLNQHPEVAAVGTWAAKVDSDGLEHGIHLSPPASHNDIVDTMLNSNALAHPTVTFRRSAVLSVGNYADLPSSEDYDLWLRLASKFRLANIESDLVAYRVRSGSATQQQLSDGTLVQALNSHFARNAPSLYGCSEGEALALRQSRSERSWPLIVKIAGHLANKAGQTLEERLHSAVFLDNMEFLIARKDIQSRLEIASRRPDPIVLEHEWNHIPELNALRKLYYWKFGQKVERQRKAK